MDEQSEVEAEFLQISTTTGDQNKAEGLIRLLVDKRLAASAQVQGLKPAERGPNGVSKHDRRWRCRFKTSKILFQEVKKEIGSFLPDDTPEIIALPIVKGSRYFLNWLGKELRPEAEQQTDVC